MCPMSPLTDLDATERERIRLEFYRAHRVQPGFSSVALRRDAERDTWFLDVGATGPLDVPSNYRGLPVRVKQALDAINAVARLDRAFL
jgi:hypothetical protein